MPSRVLNSSTILLMRRRGPWYRTHQSWTRNGRYRSVKAVLFDPPLTLQLTTIQSPNPEDRALSPGIRSDVKSSRRNSNDAPESDGPWSPRPQTYLSSDNETLKEMVIPKSPTPAAALAGEKGRPRRPRRMLWILIALIAFLVIAIGVGVGVGVGVTRNKSSKSARYSTPSCCASSKLIPLSSSSTASNSSSTSNLPHGIFNDSSVAIVALGDGDKRLLYQENTGNIREALYTASTKQWTSDVNNIVATNAKNSTPLAALLVNSTGTPFAADTGPVVFLFYIAQNNVLASRQFISGAWTTRDNFSPTGSANSTFATAPNSRALAVTSIANSTVSGEAYVFYVAQNGSATALSILPDDSGDGIVASPGQHLPESLQGGNILALASGITGSTPQVGVLTSNGTVYYELYFSFFRNGSWSTPERESSIRE